MEEDNEGSDYSVGCRSGGDGGGGGGDDEREWNYEKKILLPLTTMVTIVPVWVSFNTSFPSSKDGMSATSFLHRNFFPVMLLSVLVHKRLNPLCFFALPVCGPAFLSAVCVRVSACSVTETSVWPEQHYPPQSLQQKKTDSHKLVIFKPVFFTLQVSKQSKRTPPEDLD